MITITLDNAQIREVLDALLRQAAASDDVADELRYQFSDAQVTFCMGDRDLQEFEKAHPDRVTVATFPVTALIHKKVNVAE